MSPDPVPTDSVVVELTVDIRRGVDPRVAAAALFELLSDGLWSEEHDPPGIVTYRDWNTRYSDEGLDERLAEVVRDWRAYAAVATHPVDALPEELRVPMLQLATSLSALDDYLERKNR